MAHYATLADYRFSADIHDIRGATLYGPYGAKEGKVADVVFDHENGDIRGLVVNIGHDRKVLLTNDQLYRATTDEDAFSTRLTRAQLERLPQFDEKHLHSDQSWKEFERRQEQAIKQEEKRLEKEYDREFHDDPVEHRRGSDRLVTPEASEEPPATGSRYRVTADELTPERLAGKYPDTGADSAKLRMRPGGTPAHAEDEAHTGLDSPSWTGFQNTIRRNLHQLREGCPTCRKAA